MTTVEDIIRDTVVTAIDKIAFGYMLDSIRRQIGDEYEPNEIFTDEQLKAWALANGFKEH